MIKQQGYWFLIGLCTFSIAIGLLIGVSQSPVLGVFITGILGFIVGLGGIIFKKNDTGKKEVSTFNYGLLGQSLFFFSVFLTLGVFLGTEYRASLFKKDAKDFIWTKANPPKTVYEALDWIRVDEILSQEGFTKKQIKDLYQLRIDEIKKAKVDKSYFDGYNKTYPFYGVLIYKKQELAEPFDARVALPSDIMD